MKLKLTSQEKSELVGEGVVTLILLLLLEMSAFVILNTEISSDPQLRLGLFALKTSFVFGANRATMLSWGTIFVLVMMVIDFIIVHWRLVRRMHQIELRHIIMELHYIGAGHFEHRIPFVLKGQMQRIVTSINTLVDSTTNAMAEERRIERSKDELIVNVSHDIRTPLTSIIGYLGLIEDGQYKDEDDLLKYTHTAYLKAKQMKSLVEDLFEYTKIQQTDNPLKLTTINLGSMLEQLTASFELEAEEKGMELTSNVPDDLQVEVDPEKLARVFSNLITNAIKYGKGGKHIVVTCRKLSSQEVIVTVANDGEPIPADALPKLFDRFYRVEGSRSRKTGGTGLGLAITQGIVARHHGYIQVTSDDQWTKFKVHLPVNHADKLQPPRN